MNDFILLCTFVLNFLKLAGAMPDEACETKDLSFDWNDMKINHTGSRVSESGNRQDMFEYQNLEILVEQVEHYMRVVLLSKVSSAMRIEEYWFKWKVVSDWKEVESGDYYFATRYPYDSLSRIIHCRIEVDLEAKKVLDSLHLVRLVLKQFNVILSGALVAKCPEVQIRPVNHPGFNDGDFGEISAHDYLLNYAE